MATARDLIKGSLRLIGAIAAGETPSSSEETDALATLNDMLDSWSTESLCIYTVPRETFSLVAGTSSYTMGSGGVFNTTRPVKIENALIQLSTTPAIELPIEIVTRNEFSQITIKTTSSNIPIYLYAEGTYPLETLNLWPVPASAYTLVLYSRKVLTVFASATDTISLPPGYVKALRYNLAIELAPEYNKPIDPGIEMIAREAKANIERINIKPVYLDMDGGVLSRNKTFNWLRGE